MSTMANKHINDDKVTTQSEKLLMGEEKSQPTNVITAEDKDNSHIAGNDDVDCSYNANNVPAALPDPNCTSIDIPTAAPDQNCSSKNGKTAPMVQNFEQNVCVFCLDEGGPEEGSLIHMCSCSVLTHKECALEYIRFPGNMNDRCCQCREKLKFKVIDQQTPMKQKYVIAFIFLVIFYLAMVGVSIYLTILMIPSDLNIYLYIAIVANLSILWPLLIVFILTCGMDLCCGPRDRSSSTWSDPGCYCSGGCGDCGGGDCDCGGDGDACAIILCVLALLAILVLLIVATVYLFMSLAKFYKSFSLKSKKEIKFHHEGRKLHTLGNTKPTISKLITKNDV